MDLLLCPKHCAILCGVTEMHMLAFLDCRRTSYQEREDRLIMNGSRLRVLVAQYLLVCACAGLRVIDLLCRKEASIKKKNCKSF